MLNAGNHLDNLIPSLLSQRFDQPWEIIAVDNGSDDRTVDVARNLLANSGPKNLIRHDVIVVPSPQGYATPRNAGVGRAQAPLLAFADADGVVDEHWLLALESSLRRHPLVASRKLRVYEASVRNFDAVKNDQTELYSSNGVPFALTAGLGCTRELFEKLGGFDPHFDGGGEDVDFSFRARFQLGVEPVMALDAIYWTTVPSTTRRAFRRGFRDGRSRERVLQRHRAQLALFPADPARSASVSTRHRRRLLRLRRVNRWRLTMLAAELGRRAGRMSWSIESKFLDSENVSGNVSTR